MTFLLFYTLGFRVRLGLGLGVNLGLGLNFMFNLIKNCYVKS